MSVFCPYEGENSCFAAIFPDCGAGVYVLDEDLREERARAGVFKGLAC